MPECTITYRNPVAVSLLTGVIALVALLLSTSAAAAAPANVPTYAAVIDAGSSGTRIALFALPKGPMMTPTTIISIRGADDGIDSFADRPSQAGPQVVKPLLDALAPTLAERGVAPSAVRVTLLATAGLRLVERQRPAAVRGILRSARRTIATSGYGLGEVGVMSGQNEAAYAWIDANALRDDLGGRFGRIGIVEVGGASAQVAFAAKGAEGASATTVRIGGRPYRIVAVSYLGLGVDQARLSMARTAMGAAPCYPNSLPGQEPAAFVVGDGRTITSTEAEYRPAVCARTYNGVIARVGMDSFNTRETDGLAPREIRRQPGFGRTTFVGVSAIAFRLKDFGVADSGDENVALQRALRTTCAGPDAWSRVVVQMKGSTGTFAQSACADATYVGRWAFGQQGLGIDPARFRTNSLLGGDAPSWSRGYALSVLDP